MGALKGSGSAPVKTVYSQPVGKYAKSGSKSK